VRRHCSGGREVTAFKGAHRRPQVVSMGRQGRSALCGCLGCSGICRSQSHLQHVFDGLGPAQGALQPVGRRRLPQPRGVTLAATGVVASARHHDIPDSKRQPCLPPQGQQAPRPRLKPSRKRFRWSRTPGCHPLHFESSASNAGPSIRRILGCRPEG